MAPVSLMTRFAEWLDGELVTRRLNRSQLAAYLGSRPSTVGAWFTEDRIPSTALCAGLARVLHVPVEQVLRIAGHLPESDSPDAEPEIVPELRYELSRLTPGEQRRLVRAVELVLELREEKGGYDAAPPSPPSSPPPQGGPSR